MDKIGPFWHSTDEEFDEFERGSHFGIHVGTRASAEEIGGEFLKEVLITVQNPIRVPDLGTWGLWSIISHLPEGVLSDEEQEEIMDAHATGYEGDGDELLIKTLQSKGYDALVYENEVEDRGEDSYMVFDGSQVTTLNTTIMEGKSLFGDFMRKLEILTEGAVVKESGDPDLNSILTELDSTYPQIQDLHISVDDRRVFIHSIRVAKDERKSGIGSIIIRRIQKYAQEKGLPIVLAPEPERGKKSALERFYKKLGFVWNRGRNKDYSLSTMFGASMVWRPEKSIEESIKPAWNVKLTSKGANWWATNGDIGRIDTVGDMIEWPEMEADHPEIMNIPIKMKVPTKDSGWTRAATRFKYEDGAFHPGTTVFLNPVTEGWKTSQELLRTMAHEVTHLLQAKEGRLTGNSLHDTPGYRENENEVEARSIADTVHKQRKTVYEEGKFGAFMDTLEEKTKLWDKAFGESSLEESIQWDRKEGFGQVPNQVDIEYFGFTKMMSPTEFRKLVPPGVSGEKTIEFLKGQKDKPIGPPFLKVKWDDGIWRVIDHEGRSRADYAASVGVETMPVDFLPLGLRARNITPEMRRAPIVPQDQETAIEVGVVTEAAIDFVPAVRLEDGTVVKGKVGDQHYDILANIVGGGGQRKYGYKVASTKVPRAYFDNFDASVVIPGAENGFWDTESKKFYTRETGYKQWRKEGLTVDRDKNGLDELDSADLDGFHWGSKHKIDEYKERQNMEIMKQIHAAPDPRVKAFLRKGLKT